MKEKKTFKIEIDKLHFVKKAIQFANEFSHFSYFQSNNIVYPHGGFKELLAIGASAIFKPNHKVFEKLNSFHQNEWLFGYLGYDLKNQLEKLSSKHHNHTQFEDVAFFKPEMLLEFKGNHVTIHSEDPNSVWRTVQAQTLTSDEHLEIGSVKSKISKTEYVDTVQKLRQHIEEGDIYEINFCQEFYGEIKQLNPIDLYWKLNSLSPKPFSAFQKFDDQYLVCSSPERFLRKEGQTLISQPIKGTIRRGVDVQEDSHLKHELRNDEKELAENMMIVDLVRNDLAKSSKTGSVIVQEMFGVYSFEQVHQLISTITSTLRDDCTFIDAIRHAFPMGSMTGAPKIKVMELIEQYESSKRGIFSGAAGYITPDGDFDFNVIIRSVFLNMKDRQYSFQVGGAITYDSDPEKEYQECLLKASAITQILGQSIK